MLDFRKSEALNFWANLGENQAWNIATACQFHEVSDLICLLLQYSTLNFRPQQKSQ